MLDKELETALFSLLSDYTIEDILFALYQYAQIQLELAETIQLTETSEHWKTQLCALDVACEILDSANRGSDELPLSAVLRE